MEQKQSRIDDAQRALCLLRPTCIIWPNTATEVLLAGSFDGWASKVCFVLEQISCNWNEDIYSVHYFNWLAPMLDIGLLKFLNP